MEQPQISKLEDSNFITRDEVRILINRFEEKISVLEERLAYTTKRLDKRSDTASKRIKHLQKDVAICKENTLRIFRANDMLPKIW
jgi:hypothetical protein